jgi:hypothetical protein
MTFNYVRVGGVPHIVGKLSRAKTFFKISLQLKFYKRNDGLPKCQKSKIWEFQNSQLGNPGKK